MKLDTHFPFIIRTPKAAPGPSLTTQLMDSIIGPAKKILFADDDEAIGILAHQLEEILRMEVTVTRTVAATKAALRDGEFDVVILDFRLLNGNATPVYEELVSTKPKVRVVFITGLDLDRVSAEVHRIGPAPVYPKPQVFNLGFLVNLLGQLGIRPRNHQAPA